MKALLQIGAPHLRSWPPFLGLARSLTLGPNMAVVTVATQHVFVSAEVSPAFFPKKLPIFKKWNIARWCKMWIEHDQSQSPTCTCIKYSWNPCISMLSMVNHHAKSQSVRGSLRKPIIVHLCPELSWQKLCFTNAPSEKFSMKLFDCRMP